jgi:cysteinyl-tRNA synthetase
MSIRVYNTLSRKKEVFKPIHDKKVGIYSCGPTVYNYAHIGNWRSFIFTDILKRYLRYRGYTVTHVMNITDVDDKTIRDSRQEGKSLKAFTDFYTEEFFKDTKQLNIEMPDIIPHATETIPEMVQLVKRLTRNGHTYVSEGSTYFKISTFPDYGKLSKLDLSELKEDASGRLDSDEYTKEDARDFALWKVWSKTDGDVFWETEIGKGRPGWHIECSAMSMKYLGETFDIHTGGVDLIFPHHENEIAQSEGATGKDFVKYWIHCEHLLVDNKKMSKSLGNFYTLRDILAKGYEALSMRYILLSTHYRQKLNFTLKGLDAAKNSIQRIQEFIRKLREVKGNSGDDAKRLVEKVKEEFQKSMDDDLQISEALAAIFEFIKDANKLLAEGKLSKKGAANAHETLKELNTVLGVMNFEEERIDSEIEGLIKKREEARKRKDFAAADRIRDELQKRGIILEDTREGVRWKISSQSTR